jgi:hypothetical protein
LSRDIEKGARWDDVISQKLETCNYGIICLTPENLRSDWVVFEAGALAKKVKESRVCTYLLDLGFGDIAGPLVQFQHTLANKDDTRGLIETINAGMGEQQLDPSRFRQTFEQWWPELESRLARAQALPIDKRPDARKSEDKIDEVLLTIRALQSQFQRVVRRDRTLESYQLREMPSRGDFFKFGLGLDDAHTLVISGVPAVDLRKFTCRTHHVAPCLDEAGPERVVFRVCCEAFREELSSNAATPTGRPLEAGSPEIAST